jgi:hypothetical protein
MFALFMFMAYHTLTDGTVDMCLKHPRFATDLLIEADLRTFVEAWRGFP